MILMGITFGLIFPFGMVLGVCVELQLRELGFPSDHLLYRSSVHAGTSPFKSSEPSSLS